MKDSVGKSFSKVGGEEERAGVVGRPLEGPGPKMSNFKYKFNNRGAI